MEIQVILHPTTPGPASQAALGCAIELARKHAARLLVLRTVRPCEWVTKVTYGDRRLQPAAYYEQLCSELCHLTPVPAGVQLSYLLGEGEPVETIARAARTHHCDLIVMGKEETGGGLLRWLFQSLPEKVLEAVQCPVLLVPAPRLLADLAGPSPGHGAGDPLQPGSRRAAG